MFFAQAPGNVGGAETQDLVQELLLELKDLDFAWDRDGSEGVIAMENDAAAKNIGEFRSEGARVEVINAAMLGYCTIQSAFRLRELLKLYSPNLVAYQFVQGACPLFDGAWEGEVEFHGADPARDAQVSFKKAAHTS